MNSPTWQMPSDTLSTATLGDSPYLAKTSGNPNMLVLKDHTAEEAVLRIAHDGNVYWNGRLIESDDDFKLAMLDVLKYLRKAYGV